MKKLARFLEKKEFEYIFFDVFDTLITRTVHPEYVKFISAKKLCIFLGLPISASEVYKIRARLENAIRMENSFRGYDPEYSFQDLCKDLQRELVILDNKRLECYSSEEFFSIFRDIELEVEFSVQKIDPYCLEILNQLKEKKLNTACISDFYLPEIMLRKIFEFHGIENYFNKIFVSCDYLQAKWTGKLYKQIIKDLNINPSEVLMIGDNPNSDFNPAIKNGLQAYLINRKEEKIVYKKSFGRDLNLNKTFEYLDKQYNARTSNLEKKLFIETVFPLFHFIQKLYARLAEKKVKDVFFISKEGEFLKELFDYYQNSQKNSLWRVRSHYLIASRRSTFLPSLRPLSEENFINLFRQYTTISLFEFLESLNFNNIEKDEIIRFIGVDGDARIENFPQGEVFKAALKIPSFLSSYERNREGQKENFKNYIDSFGAADIGANGLHLVDVGWKGTIQDNIFNIFDKKIKIYGYYLGFTELGGADRNNYKEGLLFSLVPLKSKYYRVYNENKQLFEMILGASHGSAKSYGNSLPEVENIEKEQDLFRNVIQPLQENIFDHFKILCDLFKYTHFLPCEFEDYFARKTARLVFFPKIKEIEFFQNLVHFQNFGVFEITSFEKEKLNIIKRLKNLQKLISDPYWVLARGWWGPLTLLNMGLSPLRFMYAGFRYYQLYFKKEK